MQVFSVRCSVFSLTIAAMAIIAGCDGTDRPATPAPRSTWQAPPAPIVVVDPVENYLHRYRFHREGSCLHAAVIDLLKWRRFDEQAEYWRKHYGAGANIATVAAIADSLELRHAETEVGEDAFLQFCADHRFGAAIYWECEEPGDHAIVFCGYEGEQAVLLGTNKPVTARMPRPEFLAKWHECGGGAFTILP